MLVVSALICCVALTTDADGEREAALQRFREARASLSLLCLYTFDRVQKHEDGEMIVQDEMGDASPCPFGALQLDQELVTPLNTNATARQLGVHLQEAHDGAKHVQIVSTDVISAQDLYSWAAKPSGGITFEMVFRRRVRANQTMSLFSINNEFDDCTDPGFRLDLNEHHVLAFIYFVPMKQADGAVVCYEQRLFSVSGSNVCLMPPFDDAILDNPPVQIIATINPGSLGSDWLSDFYVKYTDPTTKKSVECIAHDSQSVPGFELAMDRIQGSYRLYVGNNPHNVSFPKRRTQVSPAREFRPLGAQNSFKNSSEKLRALLKQRLMSIEGPSIPKAARIFGENSYSLQILGVTFPPINEDTPFAWIRSKMDEFRTEHGDQIIDFIMKALEKPQPTIEKIKESFWPTSQGSENVSAMYEDAKGSTFDVFHFAIYKQPLETANVTKVNWNRLMPLRPFAGVSQDVHVPENTTMIVDLLLLHSIFDDVVLELGALPELGKLLFYPSKKIVTTENIHTFRQMPSVFQQKIYFQPNPDENNANLQSLSGLKFIRRIAPYAVIKFRVWKTTSNRVFNGSEVAAVNIYVDPANDPPRPLELLRQVPVLHGQPTTFDLRGIDVDGAAASVIQQSPKTLVNTFADSLSFINAPTTFMNQSQYIKVERLPQFGRLYDRNMKNKRPLAVVDKYYDPVKLQDYQISFADISNNMFSPNLIYVYCGWDQESKSHARIADELWYRLSDGDDKIFSDVAKLQFDLGHNNRSSNGAASFIVDQDMTEDSMYTVQLSEVEPLAGMLDSKVRFRITMEPKNGTLYQYKDKKMTTYSSEIHEISKRLTGDHAIVEDVEGRIVYVPHRNYYNVFSLNESSESANRPLDYFAFEPFDITNHMEANESYEILHALPFNAYQPRLFQLQVRNEPDSLVIMEPTYFKTSKGPGDRVLVPIMFDDPDEFGGEYLLNLNAKDKVSVFEFGHIVTNDDIMRLCAYERPCTLVRSTNRSRTNKNADNEANIDHQLRYVIRSYLFDGSNIEVFGTKAALQLSLSEMNFRDFTLFGWQEAHIAEFDVIIKRVNYTSNAQTHATFRVEFPASATDSLDLGILSGLIEELKHLFWTMVMTLAVCFLLANASCCSYGFCCCCSKARKRRRTILEENHRLFVDQVVQNDFEYSVLIMDLADMILEPDLLFSTCLLRSCQSASNKRNLLEICCLRSMWPILESERQGTRFALRLMLLEIQEYSDGKIPELFRCTSTAGLAIAWLCRSMGAQWLRQLFENCELSLIGTNDIGTHLKSMLDQIGARLKNLPVEIVILCRATGKLLASCECSKRQDFRHAVHLVFFNHFLGPVLLFGEDDLLGFNPNSSQRQALTKIANRFLLMGQTWTTDFHMSADRVPVQFDNSEHEKLFDGEMHAGYENILCSIYSSPDLESSYDPSCKGNDQDSELMSMSLMNLHSLLDSHHVHFEREYTIAINLRESQAHCSTASNDEASHIIRLKRLLKALSFPLASCQMLVASFEQELLLDRALCLGNSMSEWEQHIDSSMSQEPTARVRRRHHQNPVLKPASSTDVTQSVLADHLHDHYDEASPSPQHFEDEFALSPQTEWHPHDDLLALTPISSESPA